MYLACANDNSNWRIFRGNDAPLTAVRKSGASAGASGVAGLPRQGPWMSENTPYAPGFLILK
jgi:hypothetical protein